MGNRVSCFTICLCENTGKQSARLDVCLQRLTDLVVRVQVNSPLCQLQGRGQDGLLTHHSSQSDTTPKSLYDPEGIYTSVSLVTRSRESVRDLGQIYLHGNRVCTWWRSLSGSRHQNCFIWRLEARFLGGDGRRIDGASSLGESEGLPRPNRCKRRPVPPRTRHVTRRCSRTAVACRERL